MNGFFKIQHLKRWKGEKIVHGNARRFVTTWNASEPAGKMAGNLHNIISVERSANVLENSMENHNDRRKVSIARKTRNKFSAVPNHQLFWDSLYYANSILNETPVGTAVVYYICINNR